MSKLPLFLPVLLLPALFAQSTDPLIPPPTQLESFLIQKNALIVQETSRLGKVEREGSQILVEGVVARFVVRRGDASKGLRVTLPRGGKLYLDEGELDLMMKAMLAMETHFQSWRENSPIYQQDMFFTTKSGFEVGVHSLESTVSADAGGMTEGGYTSLQLNLETLRELRRLLEQGIAWLRSR